MARTKSTKVNKVSYAERVLGALTQVQKEHRKSSVHMATLRAQIKRNAEARDDHLGPQWSHWVTKAVHKLMEEGVISMNEQAIFLTAEGKNTMSVAKKSVRHLNDAEDLVIRNAVILATPSSSLSKRRRSVFSAAGLPLDDDVSASAAPPPRKRARKSNTTNTASRMTTGATATSITPVRRGRPPRKSTLATVTNAPASRDASPLTDVEDLDAEENERLRRELRGKDHEILTLKTRLHDAISARPPAFNLRARGYDSDEDAHGEEDGGDAQAQGQPMIHVTDAGTPTRSRPSLAQAKPLTLTVRNEGLGLTRTDSGTIIPHMSKRPTPAPSEGGQTEIDDQDMPPAFQIPSPQATPPISAQNEDDMDGARAEFQLTDRVERDLHDARDQIARAADDLQKAEQTFQGRIRELELQLAERNETEEALTRELEKQARVESQVKEDVKNRDIELVRLSRELGEEKHKAMAASLLVEEKSEAIEALTARIRGLEEEREAARREIDEMKDNVEVLKAELEAENGKTLGLTERLQTAETSLEQSRVELMGATSQVAVLTTKLEEERTAADALRNSLGDIRGALDDERERSSEMGKALEDKHQQLRYLQEENASLVTNLENIRREAMENLNVLEKTRGELGEAATRREALETDILAKSAELDRVQSLLEVEKGEVTTLRGSVGRLEEVVRDLQAQVTGAMEKLEVAESSKVDQETKYTGEVQRLQKAIATLEQQFGATRSELEEEQRKASEAEMEREELRALNVSLGAERLGLEIELESKKSRAGDLEREVAARVAKEKELTSELETMRMNWEMDQRRLREERAAVESVKQAQLGAWEQYDKVVKSV